MIIIILPFETERYIYWLGQIRVNGMDLASMSPVEIQQNIACVSQEPPLFGKSLQTLKQTKNYGPDLLYS